MRKLHSMIGGTDTGLYEYLQNNWDSEEEYRAVQAEMRAKMTSEYADEMRGYVTASD